MVTPTRLPTPGTKATVTELPGTPQRRADADAAGSAPQRRPDRRLQLDDVVKLMLADGLITSEQGDDVVRSGRHGRDQHPVVVIANHKLHNRRPPHRILHLEWLTEWLAGKLGIEYLHIDP